MLQGLEAIDWQALGFLNLPSLLEQLTSANERKRLEAYNDIVEKIIYGGVFFQNYEQGFDLDKFLNSEVIPFLIPFLIQLLQQAPDDSQVLVLVLLNEIVGYIYLPNVEGALYDRALKLREMVWGGLAVYLRFVQAKADVIQFGHPRFSAAALLCHYAPEYRQIFDILVDLIRGADDDKAKSALLWYLHQAFKFAKQLPAPFSDLLLTLINSSTPSKMRTTAAICFLDHLGLAAPPLAIDLVAYFIGQTDYLPVDQMPPGYDVARQLFRELFDKKPPES
jgi:hypothetical protein